MPSDNAYMRQYMLQRYRDRKAEATALLGGKCARCSGTEQLQFDHINSEDKSFTIGKLWSVSLERFLIELKKCQLLCRECHERKSCKEAGKQYAKEMHGTLSSYRYCKCDLCRKANAEATRIRRTAKGR